MNRIWLLVFLHLLFVNMVLIHNLADHLLNRFFVSTSHKQDFLFVISTWFIYTSIKNRNLNLSIETNHSRNSSMTWDFEVWQIIPPTSLTFKEWNLKMIISLLLLLATFFMINGLTRPFHCCWAMSHYHRYRWLSLKSWSSRLNSFVLFFHQSQQGWWNIFLVLYFPSIRCILFPLILLQVNADLRWLSMYAFSCYW